MEQRRNNQRKRSKKVSYMPVKRPSGRSASQNRNMYNNISNRNTRYKKRKLNKKKVIFVVLVFYLLITCIIRLFKKDEIVETVSNNENNTTQVSITNDAENIAVVEQPKPIVKKEITDWELTLANYENILPEDFEVELAEIADDREFDARAIKYLKQMINDMLEDGIKNVWVQSAYRSVERQKELYDNSVHKYLKQGKSQEEAEKLTDKYINKPGSSDHNLGLAVDFNNVDNKFEDLDAFKWLQKNAENYGFILRYPKDKEDITKISYESWHWRYVGEEHAKKMNELNFCLEEYIEYLQNE